MKSTQDGQLVAIDFTREFTRWNKDFLGRERLFDFIDSRLQAGQPQLLVLTGEPGAGKSAFAAQLTQRRRDVAAFHFCIDGRIATVTSGTVLRSIAAQLVKKLPGYAEALIESIKPHRVSIHVDIRVERLDPDGQITGLVINHLSTSDPDEDLEILLRGPLALMKPPPQPIVIVIDGLDEAVRHGGASNLVALFGKLGDLPPWVRLLYTTQPTDAVLRYLEFLHPEIIAVNQPGDDNDVRLYVETRAARESMLVRLKDAGVEPHDLIDSVLQRAADNFLFSVVLLDDIEAGRQLLDDLGALPPSLDEVYRRYLIRFCNDDWYDLHKPVLGKLAVCQDNITESQLARFAGIPPSRVHRSLGTVDRFLHVIDDAIQTSFRLYHNSLRTFLLDKKRAGYFWCDPVEEHQAVANAYAGKNGGPGDEWDAYGLRNLPSHLVRGQSDGTLRALLLDYLWLRAKLQVMTIPEVLSDFKLVAAHDDVRALASVLRLASGAISRDPEQLWMQLYSRTMTAKIPVNRFPDSPDGGWLRPLEASLRQIDDPLVWSLTGHRRSVVSIGVIPGSPVVVSGSMDKTVRFWDLEQGVEIRTPIVHEGEVETVVVSSDGKELVILTSEHTITIRDFDSGDVIDHFAAPKANDFAISGDHPWIAAVGMGIHIWNRESRQFRQIFEPGGWKCVFIPKSTHIAVRSDWHVTILDAASGAVVQRFDHGGYDLGSRSLTASPDGRFLASGGHDNGESTIKVWDLIAGTCKRIRHDHHGPIEALAFTPDLSRIVSAGSEGSGLPPLDHTVKVWDLETERCLATFDGQSKNLKAVAVSSDGRYVISAATDRKFLVWDLANPKTEIRAHQGKVTAAITTTASNRILTASDDGVLKEWDAQTRSAEQARSLKISIIAAAASANGNIIVTSCSEYSIIYNSSYFTDKVEVFRSREKAPTTLVKHSGDLRDGHYTAACVLPDCQHVVLARRDDESPPRESAAVELWDLKKGKRVRSMPYPGKIVHAIANLNDSGKIMTASTELAIWDLANSLSPESIFGSGHGSILAIAFSADQRFVAGARISGEIEIWDLATKTLIDTVAAHDGDINGVAFLGRSDLMVSAGQDGCLKVWDRDRRKLRAMFVGDDALTALTVTADGGTIVVGEAHGRVHFLQLVEGRLTAKKP